MKIEAFGSVFEAICSFTTEDQECIFVRHVLLPEEKVGLHYHEKANEWIVIDRGEFVVRVGDEEKHINLDNDKVLVIHFPKGQPHSFLPKTKVSYFVFRDCNDQIIYLEEGK